MTGNELKYIKGNLIELAKQGKFNIIIHGCNCFCNWGTGIAKQIKEEFPRAYAVDCETKKGDISKLGTIKMSYKTIETFDKTFCICIINAYTQYKHGEYYRIHTDYDAIRACFSKLAGSVHKEGAVIGIPKIGTGRGAGGDWNVISRIIEEETAGLDITVVEYEEVK